MTITRAPEDKLFSGIPDNPKQGLFYYCLNPDVSLGDVTLKWNGTYGTVTAHPITARYIEHSQTALGRIIQAQSDARVEECTTLDFSNIVLSSMGQDDLATLALLHDIHKMGAEQRPEYAAAALPGLQARLEQAEGLIEECKAALEVLVLYVRASLD